MRILIIDDDRDFADSLAELLELDNHQVELAFTANIGMELFKASPFDTIFVDILLADQNGLELLRTLKPRRPDANFFIITGHNADRYSDRAYELGATAILQKPFSPDEIRVLREQLRSN